MNIPRLNTFLEFSMKIIVLRVINSSRQKALTRSYLARSVFTQTTREYNLVRSTFYDAKYI